MAYCYECGEPLSGTWAPCPSCEKNTEREVAKIKRMESSTSFGSFFMLTFCLILLGFLLVGNSGINPSVFFLLLILSFIGLPLILIWSMTKPRSKSKSEPETDIGISIGGTIEASDADKWVRNRFLLMNLLAMIVTAVGMDSIAMNHIIFWGALLLGGLIWAIPKRNKSISESGVEKMFED